MSKDRLLLLPDAVDIGHTLSKTCSPRGGCGVANIQSYSIRGGATKFLHYPGTEGVLLEI